MVCLAAAAVVVVWEALEDQGRRPAPAIVADPVPDEARKVEARTTAAIVGDALGRRGGDLSGLPSFELAAPHASVDGTTLVRGGQRMRIHGIEGPGPTDVCMDGNRERWACGLQARAALHNVLAGKDLKCSAREALGDGNMTISCAIMDRSTGQGAGDLAATLVALGWARPSGTSRELLQAQEDAARASKSGLWRGGWNLLPPPGRSLE